MERQYKVSATNNQECAHPEVITFRAQTLRSAKIQASKAYADGWNLQLWVSVNDDIYNVSSKIDGVWEDAK